MKLKRCIIYNFGSYQDLDVDFSNKGLFLIHGPTGSGKSTILDAASWMLFGVTAKDGSADDVKSWTGGVTEGTLTVETSMGEITIHRIRGRAHQNDLYWTIGCETETKYRGKDIVDTQKLIDDRLAFSSDNYIAASYFHEYSEVGTFFTASAKRRREVFDQAVDLSFTTRLYDAAGDRKRKLKGVSENINKTINETIGKIEQLTIFVKRNKKLASDFEAQKLKQVSFLTENLFKFDENKEQSIKELTRKSNEWEAELEKKLKCVNIDITRIQSMIQDLSETESELKELEIRKTDILQTPCAVCGRNGHGSLQEAEIENKRLVLEMTVRHNSGHQATLLANQIKLVDTKKMKNPYLEQIDKEANRQNPYNEQILELEKKSNPYVKEFESLEVELCTLCAHKETLDKQIKDADTVCASLSHLQDLAPVFRSELLKKVIKNIEMSTNHYLEVYFESMFKVSFAVKNDNIEVEIQKDGNMCVYKQLSKGQRQMLKLCFSVAMMQAVSDKIGIHFDTLFFDEALDGFDANLKVQAHALFETLAADRTSVFVIDHSQELQQMFENKIEINMINNNSSMVYHD